MCLGRGLQGQFVAAVMRGIPRRGTADSGAAPGLCQPFFTSKSFMKATSLRTPSMGMAL